MAEIGVESGVESELDTPQTMPNIGPDTAGSMVQNQTNGRLICRRFARWEFLYER